MKHLTAHQKIMRAANKGTGLRLTVSEVAYLSLDDAISTRADQDDGDNDREVVVYGHPRPTTRHPIGTKCPCGAP